MREKTAIALYIRVSTEEQVQGFSLDAQKEALLDHCRKSQADVYKIYVDAGRSCFLRACAFLDGTVR